MPLTLVTGPANAGKAGVVLDAFRARLDEEPILVVPAFDDVEHAQRELADGGAVFGARVVRFEWLFERWRARAGYRAPVASELQRELIVEEAVRSLDPSRALAALESARGPASRARRRGSSPSSSARWSSPAGFTQRPARLGRRRPAPPLCATRSPRSTAAYRERLEAGRPRRRRAVRLARARRAAPRARALGRHPRLRLRLRRLHPARARRARDARRALAGADVTVSLPYERGRAAFKAVAPCSSSCGAGRRGAARAAGARRPLRAGSRAALHHLERGLFEPDAAAPAAAGRRRPAAARPAAQRAEVELVAAEVLALLRDGTARATSPSSIRDPRRYASLVEQVFGAYGIPYSLDRRVPLAPHRARARPARAAALRRGSTGARDDLLAYLRTPGC